MDRKESLFGISHLSLRALIFAALGSVLISVSSVYVALKMSALPWPTIFVTVLSMGVLKALGRTSINEINVTNTGMSAGAMVAGALAFTVPAIWIAGTFDTYNEANGSFADWLWPKFWPVLAVAVSGVVAGAFLCWVRRERALKRSDLPFPIGQAAAETLIAGDQGGAKSKWLFISLSAAAVFTALRDEFALIRQEYAGSIGRFPVAFYVSPMAVAIGYIIGFQPAVWWLAGNLLSKIGFAVLGVELGSFASAAAAGSFSLTAAIGLMVGSGVGIVFLSVAALFKSRRAGRDNADAGEQTAAGAAKTSARFLKGGLPALLIAAFVFVISTMIGLSPLVSVLLIAGLAFSSLMSQVITGQTGINPMEIFGIIVLLAIRLFVTVSDLHAFFVAAAVAVVCGFTGDMMNDYKTGRIVATNPKAQLIAELVGGLIGAVASVVALFAVIVRFGGVGGETGLAAAQAHSVAAMVGGIGDPVVFGTALLIGALLYVKGVPAMIIGIGMILPQSMSLAIFAGGLISLAVTKLAANNDTLKRQGQIVAAGLLGGEGITGTILAIIAMFR